MNRNAAELCAILLALMLIAGCGPVVTMFAYHPDRTFTVADDQLPHNVTRLFITTSDNKRLECYYVHNSSSRLLIYFHGNGGNISHRLGSLIKIGSFGVDVLGVGYRGYGRSTGRISEKGTYIDGESVLRFATDSLRFPVSSIFLMGRSIGTTVAIKSGAGKDLAGIVLVTPLTTGKDYARVHGLGWLGFIAANSFNNLERISEIHSPVVVIHGTNDEVIPFWMGHAVFEKIPSRKRLVIIENGFHNNLELIDPQQYWGSIEAFIKGAGTIE